MYASLITDTGWTWDYIDEYMTLPRAEALGALWATRPPLARAVAGIAAALGVRPAERPQPAGQSLQALAAELGMVGGFNVEVQR